MIQKKNVEVFLNCYKTNNNKEKLKLKKKDK